MFSVLNKSTFILLLKGSAIACLIAVALSIPVLAEVSVVLDASRNEVMFGDSLTVTCIVQKPVETVTDVPAPVEENSLLDMTLISSSDSIIGDTERETYHFLAYVLSPDSVRIGPYYVSHVSSDTEDSLQAESNELYLKVGSYAATAQDSIRPVRTPLTLPSSGPPLWVFALILLLIIVIALLIYYKLKYENVEKPDSALEEIDEIDEFERIRQLGLAEQERYRELYSLVSTALRGFIHRNMGIEALYSTTFEIVETLETHESDKQVTENIRSVLYEADMVKFARWRPPPDDAATIIDRALEPVRTVLRRIEEERLRKLEEQNAESGADGPEEKETVLDG
jgi:hypothetical protein